MFGRKTTKAVVLLIYIFFVFVETSLGCMYGYTEMEMT